MCSVEEDGECVVRRERHNLVGAVCRKCGSAASCVVLQSKFPYCRDCFFVYFVHKYKAALGKSKIMNRGDKVLLAFSGSNPSLCLLDLMHSIKREENETRGKRIDVSSVVLFIYDSHFTKGTGLDSTILLNEILNAVLRYGMELYFVKIDDAFSEEEVHLYQDISDLLTDEPENSRLLQWFDSRTSQTAKHELLEKARQNLLKRAASKLNCCKVFLAETSDHLANKVISGICLGRGGQLALDVAFCDDRFKDVLFIRPLQDCSKKETVFYNKLKGLSAITIPDFGTMGDKFSSIQKLTESFLVELQDSFPSTVPTVVSVGAKLGKQRESTCVCNLCKGNYDVCLEDLNASKATHISRLVSTLGPDSVADNISTEDSNNDTDDDASENTQKNLLCYACSLLLRDGGEVDASQLFSNRN